MFSRTLIAISLIVFHVQADTVAPPVDNLLYGARSQALAGAVTVSGLGAHALFHNPAGSAGLLKLQATAGLLHLDFDRSISWAGVIWPQRKWCAYLSWGANAVSDVPLRDGDGILLGRDSWRRDRISIGYATRMNFLTYLGIDLHYLNTTLPGDMGRGFGVDVGAVRLVLPPLLSFGLSVHDVISVISYGDTGRREIIKPLVTAGLAIGLAEGKVRFEYDLSKRIAESDWNHAVGLALKATDNLRLQAGYGPAGFAAGFSISLGTIDISYSGIPDPLGDYGQGVEVLWTR